MAKPSSSGCKNCFVISPIGEDGSDIRRRADQILKHVITPAARDCEYETVRADQIAEPGIITSQVIQHIVEDAMVVADLTGRNPNVFYELAIRHAIRKPVVQIIQHNETIPFDVAATRTIKVDHHDLDSVMACRDSLVKQIRAAEADPGAVDSPITVALNLQNLQESDNPLALSAAELISGMNELKSMVANTMDTLRFEAMRDREIEMMQWDEMMHATHRIRSLAKGMGEKSATGAAAETNSELMEMIARIERIALRAGDPRMRHRPRHVPQRVPPKATDEKSGG